MQHPANDLHDLDDPESPRSRALVAEGNAAVAARLHDASFEADRARLRVILEDEDKLFVCRRRGGHVYDFHRSAEHPRGLWRRLPEGVAPTPDAPWEPVLDLDALCAAEGREWAWRGAVDRPDGRRVMVELSDNGSDETVGREFDLETRAFVAGGFATPLARQELAWDGPHRLLVSAATSPAHAVRSGWPRTVRAWDRGTALGAAPVIHAASHEDIGAYAERAEGEAGPLILWTQETILRSRLAFERDGRRAEPDLPVDAYKSTNGRFVAWEPREDGAFAAGSLVLRDEGGRDRLLVEAGPRRAVEAVLLSLSRLVVRGHDDLRPWLRVLDLAAPDAALRDLSLPPGATAVSAFWHAARPDAPDRVDLRLDVLAEGMLLPPTLLRVDLADPEAELEVVARAKPSFDATGMRSDLLEAVSADGTAVPYHLALPREAAGGPVPVVVTAYGGFAHSMSAPYQRLRGPALLERGIGVAVAHIRGGGEFGPAWHKAAQGAARARGFEDCVAVARDLRSRGLAPQGGVGFTGTSNGGLLAAVIATRFPDDWGAVEAVVPVADMLRFHRYEAGAAWIEEYGDPDDPRDADALQAYSPVHNVPAREDAVMPPLLIDAPAHDDRVDPAHARRLAQRLREAGQDVLLRTSDTGGHGGGETSVRQATDAALSAAFFRQALAAGAAGAERRGDA